LNRPHIITAIGTPLNETEDLHFDGLARHLDEQRAGKIDGILVAGTMGLMQLLRDSTYRDLVVHSSKHWKGQGELLVGIGDASYVRTLERLQLVNDVPIDGVVALAPYFINFNQSELLDYYRSLAEMSKAPLYLYDLPQRTRTHLEIDTVLQLADHRNIRGIKCSGDMEQTRQLIRALYGSSFRVIVAQPLQFASLLREGISDHLDGVYAIAPRLVGRIVDAAVSEQWDWAQHYMQLLTNLLASLQQYGVFPAMTALLNSQGIPGNFAPRPFHPLPRHIARQLNDEPAVVSAFHMEGIAVTA